MADVEEKVEKVHEQQAKDDFFLLSELIHDYIGIVGAVKDAFNERVKAWQSWQTVQVSDGLMLVEAWVLIFIPHSEN